jgi:hypothetical protein
MQAFDVALEIALLALFVGLAGYALRLVVTTVRAVPAATPAADRAGEVTVVEAVQRLTEAVFEEPTLAQGRRAELADILQDLSEAATRPAAERKPGRIHAEVELLGSVARTTPGFGMAWRTWGPVLSDHLRPPR